ncbi:MAG TPA: zinc-ribbon domain-containing protein [Anaeromyxobacteraceae bacterium]|nr:zinc-ribbon domain-containing protein [Anaeromyxobacteraceae bacterium]
MIVVCSACQARFKVADEKVGPRGAKVRCSKCQTVFVVHRELDALPSEAPPGPAASAAARPARGAFDLDLEAGPGKGSRPGGVAADPFGLGASAQPAADLFAQRPAGPVDPFGAAGQGSRPAPDPFGEADPFSVPGGGAGGAFGSVDPFVATVASPGLPTSAVTDLSDLLGSAGASGVQPSQEAPAPTPPPEPSGILETGFDFDPEAAPDPGDGSGFQLQAPEPPHFDREPEPGPDLALAERTPARPLAAAPMSGFGDFAGDDPFSDQGGGLELGGPFGGGEALSFDAPPADGVAPVPAAPPELTREPPRHAAPTPAAAPSEEGSQDAVGAHRRSSQVRSVVVNAISLVALLAVSVAFLAYWRGSRPGVGMLLRPAEVLGGAAPFTATQLRSGLYERSDAPPVLFVSGAAVSHASSAVPGLRVRVEVVRKGAVLARGEARAGAVLGPEELYASRDAAGLAAAAARRARGADRVKPGESVPFLVAISDYPADVGGAGLRVTVEPIDAGAGAR